MSTLIGVPDCLIKENETTTWQTNKIGGFPDWMYQEMDIPHCGCCGQPMILVVQLYCPLTNSLYHRCLYIFVCLKRVCASQIQGWKVFRMQILDKPLSSQVGRESIASKDWNEGHDDWGEGQHDWGETNDDFREGQNDLGENQNNLEEHQDDLGDDQNDWGESQNNLVDGQNEWKEAACREDVYASVTSTALSETEHFALMNLQDVPVAEDCHRSTDMENNSGEVVAETLALDKTSLQRIINLLAVQQNDTNLQESLSEKDEVICSRDIVFPAWYINVFNETTEDTLSEFSDHLTSLLRDYEQREGKSIKCVLADNLSDKHGSTSVEVYEKAEVKHGDKQCHKFIMKLQSCPQQCVRYHWNSSPLLISRPINGKVLADKCLTCGSERVFELQLLPYLISLLKLPGQIESTVEFGTVLVYTCKSSCWSETSLWHEECIILQQDPDHHLFHC